MYKNQHQRTICAKTRPGMPKHQNAALPGDCLIGCETNRAGQTLRTTWYKVKTLRINSVSKIGCELSNLSLGLHCY